jgi:hypothetical protein
MMEDNNLEIEKKRWENRRKMAWRSWYFLVGFSMTIGIFLLFAPNEKIAAASAFEMTIVSILGVFAGIVMAYIGSAAYSDVRIGKNQ